MKISHEDWDQDEQGKTDSVLKLINQGFVVLVLALAFTVTFIVFKERIIDFVRDSINIGFPGF